MSQKKTTWLIIVGTFIALVAYDIWAALQPGKITITDVIRGISPKAAIVPCAAGFMAGYWLGRAKKGEVASDK